MLLIFVTSKNSAVNANKPVYTLIHWIRTSWQNDFFHWACWDLWKPKWAVFSQRLGDSPAVLVVQQMRAWIQSDK